MSETGMLKMSYKRDKVARGWKTRCLLLLAGLCLAQSVSAAIYYARANGNWNANTTWSTTSGGGSVGAGVFPVAGDIVNIGEAGSRTVTVPAGFTANCAIVNIGGASNNPASLTLGAATASLNVSGDVTLIRPTANNRLAAFTINAGTATVGGSVIFSGANTTATRDLQVIITTGTLTIGVDLLVSGGNAGNNTINMSGGAGTLNLAGNFTSTAGTYTAPSITLTPGTTSTFNYNGTAPQTVPIGVSSIIYNNLYFNNTDTSGTPTYATLSAAITAANVTGDVVIQTGVMNNGGFAIAGAAADTFQIDNGARFNLTGTSAMATGFGTFTFGATSIVNYGGANQTVSATVDAAGYGHLILSGSATKTAAAAFTVRGDLSITGVTFAGGTNAITVNGGVANTGTHTATTGTITLSGGAAAHALSGTGTYANLTMNDASFGATLSASPTISGALTLTNGKITTGSNAVILANAATVSGGSTASHVNGNVQKNYTSAQTQIFPVGDGTNYAPVQIVSTASAAGSPTISTTGSDHPFISSSGIEWNKSVNRYWTLTGSGLSAASTYDASFTFINGTPVDMDASASGNQASFVIKRYATGLNYQDRWYATTRSGTCAAAQCTITGLTSATLGDFAIGMGYTAPPVYRSGPVIYRREVY